MSCRSRREGARKAGEQRQGESYTQSFQIQPQKVPGETEGGAEQAPAPEGEGAAEQGNAADEVPG